MQNHKVYDFSLIDKFGDMGIVGVCIIIDDMIDTFLLSCRALGRNVEKQMLKIVSYKGLKAKYIPSDKNHQVKSCLFRLLLDIRCFGLCRGNTSNDVFG